MVTFTLKNVPDELHQWLKKQAEMNHRSLNSEILSRLEGQSRPTHVAVQAMLEKARSIRQQIPGRLSDRKLNQMKRKGRL